MEQLWLPMKAVLTVPPKRELEAGDHRRIAGDTAS